MTITWAAGIVPSILSLERQMSDQELREFGVPNLIHGPRDILKRHSEFRLGLFTRKPEKTFSPYIVCKKYGCETLFFLCQKIFPLSMFGRII